MCAANIGFAANVISDGLGAVISHAVRDADQATVNMVKAALAGVAIAGKS